MEDKQIIEMFFERSENAINELAIKYGALCNKIAYNILGSIEDAEECVSDAYLVMWNSIPPATPEPLLPYLLRRVKNIAINKYKYLHTQKRQSNYQYCLEELEFMVSTSKTVEDDYMFTQITEYINEFLKGMDKTNRIIFVGRYWYMRTYKELATITGLRQGNIRTRMTRMREQLRRFLQERGIEV